MIAVDLGHSHLIKLGVLRLFNGLERLHDASEMLGLSIEVQSTSAAVRLYRLKFGIYQIVAVKSTIF